LDSNSWIWVPSVPVPVSESLILGFVLCFSDLFFYCFTHSKLSLLCSCTVYLILVSGSFPCWSFSAWLWLFWAFCLSTQTPESVCWCPQSNLMEFWLELHGIYWSSSEKTKNHNGKKIEYYKYIYIYTYTVEQEKQVTNVYID
jgi:hypothetical protein